MSSLSTKSQLVDVYRRAIAAGMSVDELNEKVSHLMARQQSSLQVEQQLDQARVSRWRHQLPRYVRLIGLAIPSLFLAVGIYLLGSAVVPIAHHLIFASTELTASPLLAPIPDDQILSDSPIIFSTSDVTASSPLPNQPKILDVELDYTNLSRWFESPTPELTQSTTADTAHYLIDIPKVDIEQAEVVVGGTDLNGSLIQYPGTADPGQLGAPVIFGHSVLRQFYNPSLKNPNRYNSIFSYIMTLKPGDDIVITYDGVKYTYRVTAKSEVKPTDTFILSQDYSTKKIKLVTCTPEGTYLRRGVVEAELVE